MLKKDNGSQIMRLLKIAHIGITGVMFYICWSSFYKLESSPLHERFGIFVSVFYILGVFLLGRIYHMYEIGFAKVSEIAYAQSLSNVIPIFVLCITYRFAFLFFPKPWAFLGLIVIQIGFNILWTYIANKLYFKMYPPQKTIVLYRNEEDLRRLSEVSKFSHKFDVQKYVKCAFEDYRD